RIWVDDQADVTFHRFDSRVDHEKESGPLRAIDGLSGRDPVGQIFHSWPGGEEGQPERPRGEEHRQGRERRHEDQRPGPGRRARRSRGWPRRRGGLGATKAEVEPEVDEPPERRPRKTPDTQEVDAAPGAPSIGHDGGDPEAKRGEAAEVAKKT